MRPSRRNDRRDRPESNWGRRLRCETLEKRRLLTTTAAADVTGDGSVDEADYDAFVSDFHGPSTAGQTDLNSDGVVDLKDFNLFKQSFAENFDFATAEQDATLSAILPNEEFGAMQLKLNDAVQLLNGELGRPTETYEQAIDDIFDALFPGNLIILPTANEGQPSDDLTQQAYAEWLQAMDQAIEALGHHVDQSGLGTPDSTAPAAEARDMLILMAEVAQVIGEQTAQCDPAVGGAACDALQAGDDIMNEWDVSGIGTGGVGGLGRRFVGSPFPFFAPGFHFDGGTEATIVTEALAPGEMAVVLKEIRGVVAQIRPIQVPIWREPWFSRRAIIGYRTVWVWEFLPAEFIKTISMTNDAGTLKTSIAQRVVIDRGLLHFWRFFSNPGHHSY